MRRRTAGLLLAAGAGSRYGMPKALVEQDGRRWVEHAATLLEEAGCEPVVVVLGASADEVRARCDLSGYAVVVNPEWESGLGSSLRHGLAAAADSSAEAAMVLLVDTPGITAVAVSRLIAHSAPEALAAATYAGRRGHPVLLGRNHWAGITEHAVGDTGARPYLRAHADVVIGVPCEDIACDDDHDHP